jgi:hypothetical protein
MWFWWYLIVAALLCMWLAADVGDKRNNAWMGLMVGGFFGPLGVIMAYFLENRPQCKRCGSRLNVNRQNKAYSVCSHCQWESK